MSAGLKPLYRGFYIGKTFSSPVFFALAHIGLTPPAELEQLVAQRNDGITLDDLLDIAEKKYGTTELIEGISVFKPGTISVRDTLSLEVTSQTGKKREITVYHPYEDSVKFLHVHSGTTFHQKSQERNTHISRGLAHDARFIRTLAKEFPSAIDTYTRDTTILDYTHASALTYFARNAQLCKGFNSRRIPFLPYDFSKHPQVAIDVLLEFEDNPLKIAENVVVGKHILSPSLLRVFQKGDARKGIFIEGKSYDRNAVALLQAFELHCHERARIFTGQYSLEGAQTSQPCTSLVFQGPRMNCHIVYDQHLLEPLIIYKYPTQSNPDYVNSLQEFVNDPATRIKVGTKKWIEKDYWSGQNKACYMFSADDRIRKRAKKLVRMK